VTLGGAIFGAALSGVVFSVKLALFLVPALVLYELLAPLPVFARCGRALGPWLSRLGMSPPCTVPLVAGFFLGIIYGAGIIIPIADEKKIGPEELHSLMLFLCTCHAIIEDTLLFALAGSNGPGEVAARTLLLAGIRLFLALAVLGGRQAFRGWRGKKPALALD
jgi:nucleoside recognition protein